MEQFKAALPADMRKSVNPLLVMKINNVLENPEEWEMYKENLLTYVSVLQKGKFKMDSYINAVRYVSFKVMGCTNTEAHRRTFPDKHTKWMQEGVSSKDIASYTTAYNKSKLVNLIFEQTLIPTHILNAPLFQQAINVQADLMLNAKSEMVRANAANNLANLLKAPETKKVELDIGISESGMLQNLKEVTARLAANQKAAIDSGMYSPREIAHQVIVEAEVIDE